MALISFPIGTGYDHFPILFFFHWWWYLFLPALSFNPTFTRRVTLKGEGVYESLEWKWGHYAFVILLINWLLRRFIIQSLVVFSWCEMIERATHFFFKQLLINIFTNKTGPNWIDAAARWLDFVWDLQTFPLQQTCAFTVIPFLYQSISSQVQEALEPCRYWYSFLFLCLIDPQCPVCFPRDVFKVQQQGAKKKKARSIHH